MEWIPHYGGELPDHLNGKTVDVKHRDGVVSLGRLVPGLNHWRHYGTPCDIVAYRLRPPQPVHQEEEK